MQTKEQSELLRALENMPPPQVRQVLDFALFLKERYEKEQEIDESDAWSEEDMRDLTTASLRHADATLPAEMDEADAEREDTES